MKNLAKVYVVTQNSGFEWNISKEKMETIFKSDVDHLQKKGLIFCQLTEVDVSHLNIPVVFSEDQGDVITEYIDDISTEIEENKIGIRLNAFLDKEESLKLYGDVNELHAFLK